MNSNLSEHRINDRLEVPDYTVFFDQIACQGHGDIKDISSSGMKIKTVEDFELGAVSLKFKLPTFRRRKTVYGEVVWADRKHFTFGVNFYLNIPSAHFPGYSTIKEIDSFIKR